MMKYSRVIWPRAPGEGRKEGLEEVKRRQGGDHEMTRKRSPWKQREFTFTKAKAGPGFRVTFSLAC